MGEPCKNGPKESCRPTAQAVLDGGCVFESPKCDKCVWRPGSSRTRWGSFTAPALLQTLINRNPGGVLLLREKERRGEKKKREGESKGREGEEKGETKESERERRGGEIIRREGKG